MQQNHQSRGVLQLELGLERWLGILGAQKAQSALRAESELSAIHQNRVWGKTSYGSTAGSPPVLPQDRHLNLKDAAPGLSLGSSLLFD